MNDYKCVCQEPGECTLHKCTKSLHEFNVCQGRKGEAKQRKYWRAWNNCQMPNQGCYDDKRAREQNTKTIVRGVGDVIEAGLKKVGIKSCTGCKKRRGRLNRWLPSKKNIPLTDQPLSDQHITRNFIAHILPVCKDGQSFDVLEKCIDQYRAEWHNFDRVILAVSTPSRVDHNRGLDWLEPSDVLDLAGHGVEHIVVPNRRRMREVESFVPLLDMVETLDPNAVTFYGHVKGVTHDPGSICQEWRDVMIETCYANWDSVRDALDSHGMAGSFRRFGSFVMPHNHRWHYSGTYYWFRNADVFRRNWSYVDPFFAGTESWPGHMFQASEAACLFGDNIDDLYSESQWNARVRPELQRWREERAVRDA